MNGLLLVSSSLDAMPDVALLMWWRHRFGHCLPVAVNASPQQFEDPCFADRLLSRHLQHKLPPDSLCIESTETATLGHIDRVLAQMAPLRDAGVACAFDGFGTHQSSLIILRQLAVASCQLPVADWRDGACLQHDRPAAPCRRQSPGAGQPCDVGRSLGLEIVAQGVETAAQAGAAEPLGCTPLQGDLLARRLNAEAGKALPLGGIKPASTHPGGSDRQAATPD